MNQKPIRIYNSIENKVVEFKPINSDCVTMYVCGPTVYDFIHIGNARPLVVFDVLFRLLQTEYKTIKYVRNITDIDDKIINRSEKQQIDFNHLVDNYLNHYNEDIKKLNILTPSFEPKATEHIQQMIEMIQQLINKGYAYEAEKNILFDIQQYPSYGHLSHRKLEDMNLGSRIDISDYKKHPADFVLWKPSSEDQPGWQSPWGRGRPGWHIECSAMANHYLGKTIDIHGGGQDLLFPHHENERAQSCCANNTEEFANYWIHNGYITTSGEKMSKSLGNFEKLHDLLEKHSAESLRYLLLSTHYRKPLDWNPNAVIVAEQNINRYYDTIRRYQLSDNTVIKREQLPDDCQKVINRFFYALKEDLNTPLAMSIMHETLSNIHSQENNRINWFSTLAIIAKQLGFVFMAGKNFKEKEKKVDFDIDVLINQRNQARKNKDFQTADQIRNELLEHNIIIEDTVSGTQWFYK